VGLNQQTTGPSTRPTTRPGRATTRKSKPTDALASGVKMDMKDKVVRSVTLRDDAVVKSTLTGADGGVLREFELKSAVIRYELGEGGLKPVAQRPKVAGGPDATRTARPKGRLVVPGPGVMLVRDHQASEAKQKSASLPPGGIDPGNVRGAAAFRWVKSLTYDETTMTAAIRGSALVVYRSDEENAVPVRLDADEIFAVLADRKEPQSKAPPGRALPGRAQPAKAKVNKETSTPELKSLSAVGHLTVTRAGATLTAHRADYDPTTNWLVASGTEAIPATFTEAEGASAMSAEQVQWNTQTWHVKMKKIRARTGTPRR
jgi:hypothetical protein